MTKEAEKSTQSLSQLSFEDFPADDVHLSAPPKPNNVVNLQKNVLDELTVCVKPSKVFVCLNDGSDIFKPCLFIPECSFIDFVLRTSKFVNFICEQKNSDICQVTFENAFQYNLDKKEVLVFQKGKLAVQFGVEKFAQLLEEIQTAMQLSLQVEFHEFQFFGNILTLLTSQTKKEGERMMNEINSQVAFNTFLKECKQRRLLLFHYNNLQSLFYMFHLTKKVRQHVNEPNSDTKKTV